KENLEKIVEFLKENSPDLDVYGYKEWDQDTHNFVLEVIKNIIPKGRISDALLKSNASSSTKTNETVTSEKQPANEMPKTETSFVEDEIPNLESSNTDDDDLDMDNMDFDENDEELYDKL
ncbi:MAG: hypothetical protein P1P88_26410, partial [Bacteroidales bacterium]|nr:hypothetical protein [Bacteroidales bacterium]